jgi:hypothetical protein
MLVASHKHQFDFEIFLEATVFFSKRTLTLKETLNHTKHFNKKENYKETLEVPFIFNLQTISTMPPLALLPESVWRYWLRMESRRTGQKNHICPGDDKEEITVDEAP